MEMGKIVTFHVSVGQEVEAGDSIATVETDKATMEFEVQEDGIIAWINEAAVGENTKLGEACAVVVDDKQNVSAFSGYSPGQAKQAPQKTVSETPSSQETSAQISVGSSEDTLVSKNVFISPRALKAFASRGFSKDQLLTSLKVLTKTQSNLGSGPNNRIIEQDVEGLISKLSETPKPKVQEKKPVPSSALPDASYREVELSTMRRVIADRLSQSKREIPHYYLEAELRMDALLSMKKELQEKAGIKLSVNDFIVKAVAKACKEVPDCNTNFVENKIRFFDNVDVRYEKIFG